MADDLDDLDLDDDLGLDDLGLDDLGGNDLGDDDLGGDDLGGDDDVKLDSDLENILGSDLGDDDDGDVGDSELDSFFEDLSSIEDMNSMDNDPDFDLGLESEAPAFAARAKRTSATTPQRVTKSKGGLGKIIVIMALIFGALAALYFWLKDEQVMEPPKETEIVFPIEPKIVIEPPPMRRLIPKKLVSKKVIIIEPPANPIMRYAAPVKRNIKNARYLVQVANCSFDNCIKIYARHILRSGYDVYNWSDKDKYDFVEVISRKAFSKDAAEKYVEILNAKNKIAGFASIKVQSNGTRISLGGFSALDKAKEIKAHLESFFPREDIVFNLELIQKTYGTTKVYAGPFFTKGEANKAKQVLNKRDAMFKNSFVTAKPKKYSKYR